MAQALAINVTFRVKYEIICQEDIFGFHRWQHFLTPDLNFTVFNYFQKTHKDQTRHLLDILPKKNIDAFEHFVQALKGPYSWLSEQLEAEGPESYQVEEKSFFDSLLLGGLPQSPPHNVERKEKVEYDLLHCLHLFKQLR